MGLDTTHGAWHGSYGSFHVWRTAVAQAAGINLEEMQGFGGEKEWPDHPLTPLLHHSDCDGKLTPQECTQIAAELVVIQEKLPDDQWLRDKTAQFILGCIDAAGARESIKFH
jgi:hypothetical protein